MLCWKEELLSCLRFTVHLPQSCQAALTGSRETIWEKCTYRERNTNLIINSPPQPTARLSGTDMIIGLEVIFGLSQSRTSRLSRCPGCISRKPLPRRSRFRGGQISPTTYLSPRVSCRVLPGTE